MHHAASRPRARRPRSRRARARWWWPLAAASWLAVGCSHGIGTACDNALTCSAAGTRLCDQTQPGGYCTIEGCSANTCPSEAVCVKFWPRVDRPSEADRVSTTYCMRTCDNGSDCRGGYACLSAAQFGAGESAMPQASVLGNAKQKFCAVRAPMSVPSGQAGSSAAADSGTALDAGPGPIDAGLGQAGADAADGEDAGPSDAAVNMSMP